MQAWFRNCRSSIYCDLYFLLEIAGGSILPRPHGIHIDEIVTKRYGRLFESVSQVLIHQASSDPNFVDDLCEGAAQADSVTELLRFLDLMLPQLRPEALKRSVAASGQLRAEIVSFSDRSQSLAQFLSARDVILLDKGLDVLHTLAAFFGETVDKFRALRLKHYPLSHKCQMAFGSLSGDLVTLGVHPYATSDRVAGVIFHELVHALVREGQSRIGHGAELAVSNDVEEAFATAIGTMWAPAMLGFRACAPRYDNNRINILARRIFPLATAAVELGSSWSELAPVIDSMCGDLQS